MQTANEIQSNLKNLKFYAAKIQELANAQYQLDFEKGQEIGVNPAPGSIRYDSLGCIIAACGWIGTYCLNIESNLRAAISQDKLLYTKEELAEMEQGE